MRKKLIVVLGMHRSGTSAIARGLQVMGVDLGNNLLPSLEGINDKGFWEDADLNALNVEMLYALNTDWHFLTPILSSDLDTLKKNGYLSVAVKMLQEKTANIEVFAFKDPRIAKLLPFWKEAFAQSHLQVSYVIAIRHPLSVCQSLKERDGFDFEKSYLLWWEHIVNSLANTEGENSVVVDFDRLMQSPAAELTRVAKALKLEINSSELEKFKTEFLDDRLRHTVYQFDDLTLDEAASPSIVREIYKEALNMAMDITPSDDPVLRKKIAQWKDAYLQQRPALILVDKFALELRNLSDVTSELLLIKNSRSWRLLNKAIYFFRKIIPPATFRDRAFTFLWNNATVLFLYRTIGNIWRRRPNTLKIFSKRPGFISVEKIQTRNNSEHHAGTIDIIICVHNALSDVQKCLESVMKYSSKPYSLIIVDDGSDYPTQSYLREFSESQEDCTLIRNDQAGGYTKAANKGLKLSTANHVVLLNSDTIVGPEWLDRLYQAMVADERTGIVGPLSNTASWQSIPKLNEHGDWALNPLPNGMTVEKMSRFVAKYSARIYPQVPLLNGFCMMIRHNVLDDIGYLDEQSFGDGYGEEDDFNLRAQEKNWKLVIADDVYIYHAQSKSYTNERRQVLSQRAGKTLRDKHGSSIIQRSVEYMNPNRVMEGIRARVEIMTERENLIQRGRARFSGRKILFVLPIVDAGGGANVVIDEVRAMRLMGVDAQIFNTIEYKQGFLSSYPHLDIPAIFGRVENLKELAHSQDAIIATANYSVEWLKPLDGLVTLGYYIQDFEPLMYTQGSTDWQRALASYTLINGMKCFTKTEWVRKTVYEHTKAKSDVIGISVNIDLFRPRHIRALGKKPVTVVAMVRSNTAYRSPELTTAVLRKLQKKYGRMVNVVMFGTDSIRAHGARYALDFDWKETGKLTQSQVANLLSDADIFADFSTHQAMGLTALEAMACGCSVIVPKQGGAIEFVKNEENGLIAPIISQETCYQRLSELVEDDQLRQKLQIAGLKSVTGFYPEKAGFNILKSLFP